MLFVVACPGDDDAVPDAGNVRVDASTPRDGGSTDAATSADASTEDAPPTAGTSLAIGTGITAYEAIDDGAELTLVMGPQGGYHVDVAFRACGVAAMDARLRVDGFDASTGAEVALEIDRILTDRRVRVEEDGCWVRVGDLLVFDILQPSEILGREVRIEARVTSVDGVVATATKRVRVIE